MEVAAYTSEYIYIYAHIHTFILGQSRLPAVLVFYFPCAVSDDITQTPDAVKYTSDVGSRGKENLAGQICVFHKIRCLSKQEKIFNKLKHLR